MKRVLGFFMLLSLILFPVAKSAFAADPASLTISKMEVQIMPELDLPDGWPDKTPALLTGIYGTFENSGAKPFSEKIQLKVPKDQSTKIYLVAEFPDPNAPEKSVPYEFNADKNVIEWTPSAPIEKGKSYQFVVEYYGNPFTLTGNQRKFDFNFSSNYPVTDAQFYYFEPLGAQNFTLSDNTNEIFQSKYGQKIYKFAKGALTPKDTVKLSVSYQKDDFETTAQKQAKIDKETAPAASAGSQTQKSSNSDVVVAIIIGIAIVIFGLFVFLGLRGRARGAFAFNGPKSAVENRQRDTEIRKLRRQVLDGKISEDEYLELRKRFE